MTWSKPSPRRLALPPRRLAARPAIEIVEDRTLLAIVSVSIGDGPGSIYAAVQAVNAAAPGTQQEITFTTGATAVELIPGQALAALTNPTTIIGGAGVTIDGQATTDDVFQFTATVGTNSIRDLTIRDVGGAAIVIRTSSVTVENNILGVAGEGVGRGVLVDGTSSAAATNTIRGNTIGFASAAGVEIRGGQASGNLVFDNRIGTDALGADRGNVVGILVDGSPSNQIGVGGANTIGHNDQAGVRITGATAVGNLVRGNRIGVNAGGALMGNPIGVEVTTVGAGAATVIQDNDVDASSTAGVRIAEGATNVQVRSNRIGLAGTTAERKNAVGVLVESAVGNTIGGAGTGNTIALAATAGVVLRSTGATTGNVVSGNLIGTNAAGDVLGSPIGVLIDGSTSATSANTIGGPTDDDANTIGNSGSAGVQVQGAQASGNTIRGNLIGFNAAGAAMGNPIGVLVVGAAANGIVSNQIGNSSTAAVQLLNTTAGSTVDDNVLGIDPVGADAPNYDGIEAFQSAGNRIGLAGSGNRIGFSTNAAIAIAGASSTGNLVRGNILGVTESNSAAENAYGVTINSAASNVIGGAATGERNIIGFSTVTGVQIAGATATENSVLGNLIGVGPTGQDWGNAYGVQVVNSNRNRVGDAGASRNTIGHNNVAGVAVFAGSQNFVEYNTYLETNGTPPIAAADINISAGANGGILPLSIATASPDGANVKLRFTASLSPGDIVQVYGYTDAARTFAQQVTIAAATSEISIPAVELGGAQSVLVTVSRSAQGSSAFSNVVGISNLLVVDTIEVSATGKTSLWDAINNANAIGAAANDPAAPPQVISFNLPVGSVIDTSSTTLPTIRTKVSIDGPGATSLTIRGTSTTNGLVFAAAATAGDADSSGSTVEGLTLSDFGGSTIQIFSAGVTVVASILAGNAVGVQISGAAATGNQVHENTIVGNGVAVLVQNASNNAIGTTGRGNTIRDNTQAGVSIQSGNGNLVQNNNYAGRNGPVGLPEQASDIVVATGANGGILPPTVATASPSGSDIVIRFTANLQAGDVVQVYGLSAAGRTFAAEATVVAGSLNQVSIPAASLLGATSVVVSVTRAAAGTSAFSNVASQAELFVVDTVDFNHLPGRTSLWDAIANANSSGGSTAPTITFKLVDSDGNPVTDPTSWVIDVSMNPLPLITSPIIIDGGFDIDGPQKVRVQGGQDGITLGSGTEGSALQNLTFSHFVGAAVRILSSGPSAGTATTVENSNFANNVGIAIQVLGDGNIVRDNVFDLNGIAVQIQSAKNQVQRNTIQGSSAAGVQIVGSGANSNELYSNIIVASLGVGVLVGGNDNVIGADAGRGNTIAGNQQQGVVIQFGSARNTVSSNTYADNGPPVSPEGTFLAANDIVVVPGANQGILPADVISTTYLTSSQELFVQFDLLAYEAFPSGTAGTKDFRVEIYQRGPDGTLSLVPYTSPTDTVKSLKLGLNSIRALLTGFQTDIETVITLSDFASAGDPGNTSAFSLPVEAFPPNVVVSTEDYLPGAGIDGQIPGTLRFALANPIADPIRFQIPADRADDFGRWNIRLDAPIDVTARVQIDGWNSTEGSTNNPDLASNPRIWVRPGADSVTFGLRFVGASANSVVESLGFAGFTGSAITIGVDGVKILGNQIVGGTPASNNPPVPLSVYGVGILVNGGANSEIGGTSANHTNVLGRLMTGVKITGAASETRIVGNQIGTNGFDVDNLRNGDGIWILGSSDNFVEGNLIGGSEERAASEPNVPASLGAGVRIEGASARNSIAGNNLGVVPFRNVELNVGNKFGIFIGVQADGNFIGSDLIKNPNVIGRNTYGVVVQSSDNSIAGNYIGTDTNGRRFANEEFGLLLQGVGAHNNTVGRTDINGINVIGHHFNAGVAIFSGAHGNRLINNYIGTMPDRRSISNGTGILIYESSGNVIGPDVSGTDPINGLVAGANYISGNARGIQVVATATTSDELPNVISGNLIGGERDSTAPLAYPGNSIAGIEFIGGRSGVVGARNGSDLSGPQALTAGRANLILGNGVGVHLAQDARVDVRGNLISQNVLHGVQIEGTTATIAPALRVAGNFIGTSFDGLSTRIGLAPSGNGLDGIVVLATGDAAPTAANVEIFSNLISGNGLSGVQIASGGSGGLAAKVSLRSNLIGLNLDGNSTDAEGVATGNALDGVRIADVGGVEIGSAADTTFAGRSNVISGNLGRGVEVVWSDTNSIQIVNQIVNNIIGAAKTGDRIVTQIGTREVGTGNLSDGVFLFGDALTEIRDNLIGGNRAAGIHAAELSTGQDEGSASRSGFRGSLKITRNYIGTNPGSPGLPLGDLDLHNGSDGVFIDKLKADEGMVVVNGNFIGANRANGVNVLDSSQVQILGNLIGDVRAMVRPRSSSVTIPDPGNYANGISLIDSDHVTVAGEMIDGEMRRNIISGNRGNGIVIVGNGSKSYHQLLGNVIGADVSGTRRVPNFNSGILINGSSGNTIGSEQGFERGLGDGNLLSGNRLYGIIISGADVGAADNSILGNRIGTNASGTGSLENSADGLFILDAGATYELDERGETRLKFEGNKVASNIISGNGAQGVRIFGSDSRGNQIENNRIGVGADSRAAVPNKGNGIIIDNAGANAIGSASPNRSNVLSGNGQSGIMVSSTNGTSAGTWIGRNFIGTDATGTTGVANGANGVFVFGASGVTIDLNVISGNNYDGVQIFSPVLNARADSNLIRGNVVGLDAAGLSPLRNQGNGVSIINGFNNYVGMVGGVRNTIAANANGIVVDLQTSYVAPPSGWTQEQWVQHLNLNAVPNRISGNVIGLDATGWLDRGNTYAGVLVNNAYGTLIGHEFGFTGPDGLPPSNVDDMLMPYTITPGEGHASNVISGNGQVGIHLTGSTTGTKVSGNYLGTDIQGQTYDAAGNGLELSSTRAAVLVDAQATYNSIGGVTRDERIGVPGTGNLITQSRRSTNVDPTTVGVLIDSIGAANNQVLGNVIGLGTDGRSGSNGIGVLVNNAKDTRIGWLGSARNVITGNAVAGVEINGPLSTNNGVFNNYIGTHSNGTTRPGPRNPSTTAYNPSQEDGVLIVQSSGNLVGYGTFAEGLGNLISGNGNGVNIATQDSNAPAASTNYVDGNRIGTDAAGMKAVPNFRSGVFITAAPNTHVRNNLISANGLAGVQIYGGQSQQGGQANAASLGTTIVNNTIGLNAQNVLDFSPYNGATQIHPVSEFPAVVLPGDNITINLGAQQHGVVVIGASGNRIGLPGQGNIISGNTLTGVYISKLDNRLQTYATPVDNVIQNNKLWTNGIYGVLRYDAPNGNPALEPPSPNSNDFTGTPIPIGDFVTGFNAPTGNDQAESILLGNTSTTPSQPGRRPRPAPIQRPGLARAARAQNR